VKHVARLLVLLSLLCSGQAFAVQADEVLLDPALESRARIISQDLRCLVCQNQSIDDSAAPLARDLRLLVREQLKAGRTDQEVIAFIVDRYGEFVLLRPQFELHTAVLWIGPFVILLLGALALFAKAWRNRRLSSLEQSSASEAALTTEERQRLLQIAELYEK
jgi:cytochrome c-type biogenesis protein CcmH